MVKTKREYIAITFIISSICLAVTITSIATNNWIESDGIYYQTKQKSAKANYGLFSGKWNVNIVGTKFNNEIKSNYLFSFIYHIELLYVESHN